MKRFCMLLALLLALSTPCLATGNDLKKALPEEAYQILQEVEPGSTDVAGGLSALWKGAGRLLRQTVKGSVQSAFGITGVCLLLSMTEAFAKSAGLQLPGRVPELAGTTAVLLLAVGQSGSLLSLCQTTIDKLDTFTKLLISVFAVASAAAGRPASAVASAGGAMLFSNVILTLSRRVFLPGITVYLLLIYSGIISGSNMLRQAALVGKWAVTNFFKIFLTAFFAYMTFTGLVTGSADAAAVKTAQTLTGSVPLVGSVIAGASDTILSGAALLRAGVGFFGTLGAAAICLTPFIQGVCHLLVYKVLSVFSASFAEGGLRVMLDSIAGAYSLLLGILTACCAVQFIAIVVGMTVAGT